MTDSFTLRVKPAIYIYGLYTFDLVVTFMSVDETLVCDHSNES